MGVIALKGVHFGRPYRACTGRWISNHSAEAIMSSSRACTGHGPL